MMNMKKLLCLAMALLLALSLAACSAKSASSETPAATEEATEAPVEETAETPAEEATEETAEEATEETAEEATEETAEAPAEEAAEGTVEEQLAAAKTRIAELEALVAKYQPVYESQVVATFGDEGVIWKDDATSQYNSLASMYQQYGISVESFASEIKQSVLESMVQDAVLDAKAQELGLKDLSEETLAELQTQAQENFDTYVQQYKSYFAADSAGNALTDEEAVAQTTAYLNQNGLTVDALLTRLTENHISEQLHAAVTDGVTVTDEEIQAKYDSMVAADQDKYTDDYSYNSARSGGTVITWNPEGYRAVKHVLIKFTSEQATQYNTLKNTIDSLNTELESLEEATEAAEAETTEETAEAETAEAEPAEAAEEETAETETAEAETEAAETAEAIEAADAIEAAETRTREQIETELGQAGAELEALYSTLLPKAQEVIDAFNAGTEFDALIEQYGEDPGMTTEPSKTQGYAVAEGSTYWESAFTEGAMSIAEAGQISEPVRGTNGIHIIYYVGDITAGAVPFEDVSEEVQKEALSDKVTQTYNDQVTAWIEEAAPTYYVDRF